MAGSERDGAPVLLRASEGKEDDEEEKAQLREVEVTKKNENKQTNESLLSFIIHQEKKKKRETERERERERILLLRSRERERESSERGF